MERFYNKKKEAQNWSGSICPKIRKRLAKNIEWANTCYVAEAGEGVFDVADRGTNYIVELFVKSCSCRRWNLTGIPCSHAIACMRHERIAPKSQVHSCYSIETFCKAYGQIIMPCKDRKEWQKMNGCPILPPLYLKKVGRPARNRMKTPHEIAAQGGGNRMTRHGVVIHCSHCGDPNHNRKGRARFKAGLPPTVAPQRHGTRQRKRRAAPSAANQEDSGQPEHEDGGQPEVHYVDSSEHDEPVITQLNQQAQVGPQNMQSEWPQSSSQHTEHTMLNVMMADRPMPKVVNFVPRSLPDSSFILAARDELTPVGNALNLGSTSISTHHLQQKVQAMKYAKSKVFAVRREETLEAKYESHHKQVAAVLAKRKEAAEKKAADALTAKKEAQAKKLAVAEAKKREAQAKKAALLEAKKLAAAEKSQAADAQGR